LLIPITRRRSTSQQNRVAPESPSPTQGAYSYCDYEDGSTFLICVLLLGAAICLTAVLRLFSALTFEHPSILFQGIVLMCILFALYAILKLRIRPVNPGMGSQDAYGSRKAASSTAGIGGEALGMKKRLQRRRLGLYWLVAGRAKWKSW
jgi:hypothetical protein